MLFQWIDSLFEWGILIVTKWFGRLRFVIQQVLAVVIFCLVVLWISMFLYGCFYYTYMPTVAHERDLFVQFRSDCSTFGDGFHCSFPEANVTLVRDHQSELLMRGQTYVVSVELDMPESLVNQNHGMFMTVLQFYTRHGEIVKSSSRSAMLRYKSPFYYIMETLFYLPSFLLSTSEQKQAIVIEFFNNYQENPYKPALGVFFQIQSRRIEVYKASLKIHATFYGLRYLLFHWPTISAIIGISVNCFFISLVLLIAWCNIGTRVVDRSDELKKLKIREDLIKDKALKSSSSLLYHSSSRPPRRSYSTKNIENLSAQRTSKLHVSNTYPGNLVGDDNKTKKEITDHIEETDTLLSSSQETSNSHKNGSNTDAAELRQRQTIVTPTFS